MKALPKLTGHTDWSESLLFADTLSRFFPQSISNTDGRYFMYEIYVLYLSSYKFVCFQNNPKDQELHVSCKTDLGLLF